MILSSRRAAVRVALERALEAWTRIVGAEHVEVDRDTLELAARTTFARGVAPLAIVRPGSTEEVRACMRIAHDLEGRVPIYPISTGKNWGYGSGAALGDGVVLHLGRMKKISDLDPELATVTVEPGVTQADLVAFLREKAPHLWLDVTASSPGCSVLANVLERGVGFTPHADHAAHACNFAVVLPNGDLVRTGMGKFAGSPAARVHRAGVGPSLDGLFTQSSFGVVTEMTIWLYPKPESFTSCHVFVEKEEELATLIDVLRPMCLSGARLGAPRIVNTAYLLTSLQQYPWEESNDRTPLSAGAISSMKKSWNLGAWHATFGIYGTASEVRAAKHHLRRAFRGRVRGLHFFTDRKFRIALFFSGLYRFFSGIALERVLGAMMPMYGVLSGQPSNRGIGMTYWRKRMPVPLNPNPDRDRCGFMWCAPVVPLKLGHLHEVTAIARALMDRTGFEPLLAFNLISGRAAYCDLGIAYDRDKSGEDERALACHDELFTRLARAGYFPHRLGLQSMHLLAEVGREHRSVVLKLKSAIDPFRVLAPGRYE